ncbi:g5285 [Coccomyxa elongata]
MKTWAEEHAEAGIFAIEGVCAQSCVEAHDMLRRVPSRGDEFTDPDDREVMSRDIGRVLRRTYQRGDAPVRCPPVVPLAHLLEEDEEAVASESEEFQSV